MKQSDEGSFIDNIGLYNKYYLGDSVLLEPIANSMIDIYGSEVSIISNYPELFENHPTIKGYHFNNVPPNTRLIDMSKSIRSIEKTNGNKERILSNKFDNMYLEAGISLSEQTAPKLYLSSKENDISWNLRDMFTGPCIGVCFNSRHEIKDYPYGKLLVGQLSRMGYNVFIFDTKDTDIKGYNIFKIISSPLRKVMIYLNFMDIVVGCDTGIMHIAGALNKQIIVMLYKEFYDLYKCYSKCIPILTKYSRFGFRLTPVKKVIESIEMLINKSSFAVSQVKQDGNEDQIAVVRFRGIGDIILTLPVIATYKKLHPNHKITYVTSEGMVELLKMTKLFENVIGKKYDHGFDSDEPLPPVVDFSRYSMVYNLINRVDFLQESQRISRIDLFARLLGIDKVDYSLDWSVAIPDEWKESIWKKLAEYGIVPSDTIIVLQTGSKGLSRMWPRERQKEFVKLANDYKVLLVNDIVEEDIEGAINLTGVLSFKEYVSLLAICNVIVSPDSGSVHIGGWLNKLTIGLFGSVDPRLRVQHYDTVYPIVGKAKCAPCNDWMTKQCNNAIKPLECMYNISAMEVMNLIRKIL